MFKKTFLILSFIATLVGLALGYENKENPGALKDRQFHFKILSILGAGIDL